jgi:hypothetical protein
LIRQKRSIIGFSQYKVNKALAERDKKKQNELEAQGFILGKNDKKNEPKNVKDSYLKTYQLGFNKGQ